MTTTQIIIIVAVIAVILGLNTVRSRRQRNIERRNDFQQGRRDE